MAARANTLAQAFSQKILYELYDKDLVDEIVNRDYEGEINAAGSKLNMLNFDKVSEKTYSGSNLTADDLTENNAVLTIGQQKSFYWKEKTLDNWKSYVKNPHPTIVDQVASERRKNMEEHVLGFYGDIASGNWDGTSYTTGTVTVDVTTGLVTGSGTTFTSGMVGKPFKATGHTKWYRIKTYTSATSITIEDDKDDIDSAYTGGAIAGGSTYEIQANTSVQITTSNLLQRVGQLRLFLDEAEANGYNAVPDDGKRFLIVPPKFQNLVIRASGVALHVPDVYSNLVQKGFLGMLDGFKVFVSNRLTGDNTDGYYVIAGHPNWLTFAEKILNARMEEDLIGNFGVAYKDLFVYGGKVADARRSQAALGLWTFA